MYIPVKNHYLFDNCTDLFLTEWNNYWINVVRIVDYKFVLVATLKGHLNIINQIQIFRDPVYCLITVDFSGKLIVWSLDISALI